MQESFVEDFNLIIEKFEFYDQLKPTLKYALTEHLFGEFAYNFKVLFIDEETGYEAE